MELHHQTIPTQMNRRRIQMNYCPIQKIHRQTNGLRRMSDHRRRRRQRLQSNTKIQATMNHPDYVNLSPTIHVNWHADMSAPDSNSTITN